MNGRRDKQFEIRLLFILLVAALVVAFLSMSRQARGEPMRASSVVYQTDNSKIKSYRKRYRTYRSYRTHRYRVVRNSRAAGVAAVSLPASREAVPDPSVRPDPPTANPVPGVQDAALKLVTEPGAASIFAPNQLPPAEPVQWFGPVMLERGDPEPAEPSSLHLAALGAITAAFCAGLFYAVVRGQQDDRPEQQWGDGPEA